jgi:hypothetical protein
MNAASATLDAIQKPSQAMTSGLKATLAWCRWPRESASPALAELGLVCSTPKMKPIAAAMAKPQEGRSKTPSRARTCLGAQ